MRWEIIEFFIIKQIKKPRLVLCSVVKHLGSGRALKKWGKTLDCVSCFPLHFFRALPLPTCFTAEHSTVEASLFVNEKLLLACGKKIPSLSCACVEPLTRVRRQMLVVNGRIGEKFVDVLRDTGCSEMATDHRFSFPVEDSLDLLGVTIDNHLNFNKHVSLVCKKVNNQLNYMIRFRNLICTQFLVANNMTSSLEIEKL